MDQTPVEAGTPKSKINNKEVNYLPKELNSKKTCTLPTPNVNSNETESNDFLQGSVGHKDNNLSENLFEIKVEPVWDDPQMEFLQQFTENTSAHRKMEPENGEYTLNCS